MAMSYNSYTSSSKGQQTQPATASCNNPPSARAGKRLFDAVLSSSNPVGVPLTCSFCQLPGWRARPSLC